MKYAEEGIESILSSSTSGRLRRLARLSWKSSTADAEVNMRSRSQLVNGNTVGIQSTRR